MEALIARVSALESTQLQLLRLLSTPAMVAAQAEAYQQMAAMMGDMIGAMNLLQSRGLDAVKKALSGLVPPEAPEPRKTKMEEVQELTKTLVATIQAGADTMGGGDKD
jgi:hypothetical protein